MKIIQITLIAFLCSNIFYAQSNKYLKIEKNTMEGTLYGIKNKLTNQEIIPPIYNVISDYSSGKFVAIKDKFVGVLDTLNKTIIPFKYSYISDYLNDRTFLSTNGKLAMADENGKILTPFIYDDVLGYQDGVLRVVINNKIGYISNQGKTILPCKFDDTEECQGDFIVIYSKKWDSYGYDLVTTNQNGKEINRQDIGTNVNFPLVFNTTGKLIYKGGNGERIIIPPTKKIAIGDKYLNGKYDRQYTIIKSTGEKIAPIYYRGLKVEKHWISITTDDETGWKYGIMNFEGQIILKPRFKTITDYEFNNNQLAKVAFQNGGFFYINKEGNCVVFDNQVCPE